MRLLIVAFFICCLPTGLIAADQLQLSGAFMQGGMVIGHGVPGMKVQLDRGDVPVTPDGTFVFGFGREAPPQLMLVATWPDGRQENRVLLIEQRTYPTERVEGLPPATVTPPPDVLQRIAADQAAVAEARAHLAPDTYWLKGFIWPAAGRVSGVYGSQRILNGEPKRPHYGLDVAGPPGTPVVAPAAGIVRLAATDFYYEGGIVIIDHGFGVTSTLFHLGAVDVSAGQQVIQGQKIGEIGATGRASGPHVDWRLNWGSVRLDPQLQVSGTPTPAVK